jgi:hypothetical protein
MCDTQLFGLKVKRRKQPGLAQVKERAVAAAAANPSASHQPLVLLP